MTVWFGVTILTASIRSGLSTPTFLRVSPSVLGVEDTLYSQDAISLGALQAYLWLFCCQNTTSQLILILSPKVMELDPHRGWSL